MNHPKEGAATTVATTASAGKKRKSIPKSPGETNNPSAWQQRLYELILFQAANNGSSIIPYDDVEHADLAEWVRNERIKYKQFIKGELLGQEQADHVVALKQIGFVFEARTNKGAPVSKLIEANWQERYNELVQYKRANNGDPNPPTTSKLGKWVNCQRMAYKEYKFLLERFTEKYPNHRPLLPEEMPRRDKSRSIITRGRIDKLNALEGFKWDLAPRWTSFEQRLEEYRQFRREEGHGFIPQHYRNNPALGKWVSKMRYEYTLYCRGERSQLTRERIRQLEDVNFEFSSNSKRAAVES